MADNRANLLYSESTSLSALLSNIVNSRNIINVGIITKVIDENFINVRLYNTDVGSNPTIKKSDLDKFFKNYKSQFMNIRKMCEELSSEEITVNGLSFKDIINEAYNEYSQITHTIFPIEKKEIKDRIFDIIRNCFTMNNVIIAVLYRKYNLMLPENLGIQLKACSEVLEKHIRI